ncbi:MAG TPA: DUF4130 domain-containing protein, partial [Ramlibacter sp.]|uniref:DUF4130 domain-containing protein n=1 Tax=Ramlibacter sp. TaxID=1917967 RepID=UPI002D7E314E
VLHRDPQRFDLLYRSLWRLVHEPELKNDPGDEDLARLRQMAQAVRRDIQKMKARIEFHPLVIRGVAVPVAWYEPAHYICEEVGIWLARRDPEGCWMLLTPDRSMRWDGEHLLSAPALAPAEHGQPMTDDERARALEALPWV